MTDQLQLDMGGHALTVCRRCCQHVVGDIPYIMALLKDGQRIPYHLRCFTEAFDEVDTPGVDNCVMPGVDMAHITGRCKLPTCAICSKEVTATDELHLNTWNQTKYRTRGMKGTHMRVMITHDDCWDKTDAVPNIPQDALVAPLPYRAEPFETALEPPTDDHVTFSLCQKCGVPMAKATASTLCPECYLRAG